MNIVENIDRLKCIESIINEKSKLESGCIEFFVRTPYFIFIDSRYYISNFGRIYDSITDKFIQISEMGMVSLQSRPIYYEEYVSVFYNMDNLMMNSFKNVDVILKYLRLKKLNYKIIHKDNNPNNYNLNNLYCKFDL